MNCSRQGSLPSLLGRAYIVKTTKDTSTNVLDLAAGAKPARRMVAEEATPRKSYKSLERDEVA